VEFLWFLMPKSGQRVRTTQWWVMSWPTRSWMNWTLSYGSWRTRRRRTWRNPVRNFWYLYLYSRLIVVFSRYEDFTTIGIPFVRRNNPGNHSIPYYLDWIQDSVLERKRRLRHARISQTPRWNARALGSFSQPWAQFSKIMTAGQSWFVLSLVGAHHIDANSAANCT